MKPARAPYVNPSEGLSHDDKPMSEWQLYEQEKSGWIASNPAACADEYEQAMRLIAKKCGV